MNDYLNICDSDLPLDQYIIANIGGNETVSAMFASYVADGTSGSSAAMAIYEKMEPIIAEKDWSPVERKEGLIPSGQTYIGNEGWKGHYLRKYLRRIKKQKKADALYELMDHYHQNFNYLTV